MPDPLPRLNWFLKFQRLSLQVEVGGGQIGDDHLVCPGVPGKVVRNQSVHMFQRLGGPQPAEIVPFRQHFHVGHAILLLEYLQKNIRNDFFSPLLRDEPDGKGEGGQQTQGLPPEEDFRGALFERQLSAGGGKGLP